jgi:predicted permease
MRRLLVQLLPSRADLDVTMDWKVFSMAVFAGVSIALVLGTLTAWHGTRVGILRALKAEDLAARLWVRKGLIIGQLALSVVVLLAAGLFVQTLQKLRQVNPGFERQQVLIVSTDTGGYSPEQRTTFNTRLLADVRGIPGVVSAALSSDEPLGVSTGWNLSVTPDPPAAAYQASASVSFVSPDYFRTLGIPVLRGREFDERDGIDRVIVNENFVRTYLGTRDPLGYRVSGNGNMRFEIVGVVRDSASTGLRDLDQQMLYVPGGHGVLHVRAAVPAATLRSIVEAAVHRLDANVPVFNVRTIEQQLDRAVIREQTFARMSVTFAVLALVLSAVGLYGVMANAVSRRTKVLGIRLALGADPRAVVTMIVREAGLLIAAGIACGVPSALALAHAFESLLFGVQPTDVTIAAIAVVVLTAVAFGSAWLPARRAARVDPLTALRAE